MKRLSWHGGRELSGRHARRTVRVSSARLIELLRGALRASELQREIEAADATTRQAQARSEARRVVEAALADAGLVAAGALTESLVEDPPVDATGRLHRPALLALAESRIWDLRLEHALAESTAGGAL